MPCALLAPHVEVGPDFVKSSGIELMFFYCDSA